MKMIRVWTCMQMVLQMITTADIIILRAIYLERTSCQHRQISVDVQEFIKGNCFCQRPPNPGFSSPCPHSHSAECRLHS